MIDRGYLWTGPDISGVHEDLLDVAPGIAPVTTYIAVTVLFTGTVAPDLRFERDFTDQELHRFFKKLGDAFASVGPATQEGTNADSSDH